MDVRNLDVHEEVLAPGLFIVSDGVKTFGYSPLSAKIFEIYPAGKKALKLYFSEGADSDGQIAGFLDSNDLLRDNHLFAEMDTDDSSYEPTNVTLSLTNGCNLRCIYCYANAGEPIEIMPWETAQAAIDIASRGAKSLQSKKLHLSFHGGGEATVVWDLLERCVEYTIGLCQNDNTSASFSLVTNATLIDSMRAQWLAARRFSVTASVDGPEDIQNHHRPTSSGTGSFGMAYEGMRNLHGAGVDFGIRATVTRANVARLDELIMLAVDVGANGVAVEPFSLAGRAMDGIELVNPYDFLEGFLVAKSKAREYNIDLRTSALSISKSQGRFCSADGNIFCVLPDGRVSSCTRVTQKNDELADIFVVGRLIDGNLVVEKGRVDRLRRLRVSEFIQCQNCFALRYCAGGCHSIRLSTGKGVMPTEHCVIARTLAWIELNEMYQSCRERR